MRTRILVLLIVLALAAVNGINAVSAQSSTLIRVVTLGETNVYADASAEAEVAATLPISTVMVVHGVSGDFFAVDGGYVMASDVALMNLPALAPKMIVSTNKTGVTGLLAEPDISSDILAVLNDGTVASLLAVDGPLAFIESAGQQGWSVITDWETAPNGLAIALIHLKNTDQVSVFAEANIDAAITSTLTEGDRVYVYEDTGEDMVNVLLADGSTGYVRRVYVKVLPSVWANAAVDGSTDPTIFDKPNFGGRAIASLSDGAVVTYIASVDDFWAEVYYAPAGVGYVLKAGLSEVYAAGTVQEPNSLVRNGPGSQYTAVAQLQRGDQVLVKGLDGGWFNVAIPYEKYFAFDGREPYMFGDLLANQSLEYDFDVTLFTGEAGTP